MPAFGSGREFGLNEWNRQKRTSVRKEEMSIPVSEYLVAIFLEWRKVIRPTKRRFQNHRSKLFPNNERPSVMDSLRETWPNRLRPLERRTLEVMPRLLTLAK
jgi:hypothetical protein